jgi:hypothetical protein
VPQQVGFVGSNRAAIRSAPNVHVSRRGGNGLDILVHADGAARAFVAENGGLPPSQPLSARFHHRSCRPLAAVALPASESWQVTVPARPQLIKVRRPGPRPLDQKERTSQNA